MTILFCLFVVVVMTFFIMRATTTSKKCDHDWIVEKTTEVERWRSGVLEDNVPRPIKVPVAHYRCAICGESMSHEVDPDC